MGILENLNGSPIFHSVIDGLKLRSAAGFALAKMPIVRKTKNGIKYRLKYVDSIPLEQEIFTRKVYDRALTQDITTFVDLGCNVGQFVARVADFTGRRDLRGIAIDADRDMFNETAWVIRANALDGVVPVLGLVGSANESGKVGDFFVNDVKIKSSRFTTADGHFAKKDAWRKTSVPYLDIELLWRGIMGDERCHLLKIDIEGSEADFITPDNPFLKRVDRIVIESHKWIISSGEIRTRLAQAGFIKNETLEENEMLEVASYDKNA
jgi:FkbM family methyltransferase